MKLNKATKANILRLKKGEITSYTCQCGDTVSKPNNEHDAGGIQPVGKELLLSVARVECSLCGLRVQLSTFYLDYADGHKWAIAPWVGKMICPYCYHLLTNGK